MELNYDEIANSKTFEHIYFYKKNVKQQKNFQDSRSRIQDPGLKIQE